ncbi:nucleobindin 1 isoform X1 [Rhipicephalus microplus]|uniref:nucleobindin 1 isoform X1 n=1 Tax=Rhipicephalus microplus TaxID=6941 RepID=UPI003F6A6241
MTMKAHLAACLLLLILQGVVGPPVDKRKKPEEPAKGNTVEEPPDFGLEYSRYLQEVVQALEDDPDFSSKLKAVNIDDIRSGNVAHELEFVKHDVRNRLDELKRIELDRLRKLTVQAKEKELAGLDRNSVKLPHHIDYQNPHTFEIEDLKKLIVTATKDLEALDEQRKAEFKEYEMRKELEYRKSLENMTAEERLKVEQQHNETIKHHKEHPAVHEPGSKPQLQEVWQEQDHMDPDDFNPNTFFAMHDLNGDGYLDPDEIAAVLNLEVKKMYRPDDNGTDPVERNEEVERMREHVLQEGDSNKDGLLSHQEFLDMTHRRDFEKDEGWKGLDEQQVYSEDELRQYQQQHPDLQLQYPYQQYHGGPMPPQYQGQQMPQYQHMPPQGAQYQGLPSHQGVPPQQHQGQLQHQQGQFQQQQGQYQTQHGQFQPQPGHPQQQQQFHPASGGMPQVDHAAAQQYAAQHHAAQQQMVQQQMAHHQMTQQHLAQQQQFAQQPNLAQQHVVQQHVPQPQHVATGQQQPAVQQQVAGHYAQQPAGVQPAAQVASGVVIPQGSSQQPPQHQQAQVPTAGAQGAAAQAAPGGAGHGAQVPVHH